MIKLELEQTETKELFFYYLLLFCGGYSCKYIRTNKKRRNNFTEVVGDSFDKR